MNDGVSLPAGRGQWPSRRDDKADARARRMRAHIADLKSLRTVNGYAFEGLAPAALPHNLYDFSGSGLFRKLQLAIKRGIDICGALSLLLLLSPLLLLVAVIIRLTSKGPVLFRQSRTGRFNRPFEIFKFRSMYTDLCDNSGVAQTVSGDARITPIGRVLRRTNIDELPQLINVLKGDMSLVGPRPHVPNMLAAGMPYEELVSFYPYRHAMRPGITGLAQAHGLRGPTVDAEPATQRIIRDMEYIRDFSLWLDVKIMWRTVVNEMKAGRGF